jgi:nitroreductase
MGTTTDAPSFIALLRGLRAVRQFRPGPVPEAAVRDIVEVVRWSGSAGNGQPWQVVLVRDRETLRTLAALEGYADHLAGAALAAVLVMPGANPEWDAFDEGRLSERVMLAAAAHGLGSSIGWLRGSGPDEAKRLLGVPSERTVRTAISIGYPTEEAARRGGRRRPVSDIVREERLG